MNVRYLEALRQLWQQAGLIEVKTQGLEIAMEFASFEASILPFDEWTEVFGSERLTGALLDRLTHHVHILEMNAESYRLSQSRSQQKTKTR